MAPSNARDHDLSCILGDEKANVKCLRELDNNEYALSLSRTIALKSPRNHLLLRRSNVSTSTAERSCTCKSSVKVVIIACHSSPFAGHSGVHTLFAYKRVLVAQSCPRRYRWCSKLHALQSCECSVPRNTDGVPTTCIAILQYNVAIPSRVRRSFRRHVLRYLVTRKHAYSRIGASG
jgi:hypothetical protein